MIDINRVKIKRNSVQSIKGRIKSDNTQRPPSTHKRGTYYNFSCYACHDRHTTPESFHKYWSCGFILNENVQVLNSIYHIYEICFAPWGDVNVIHWNQCANSSYSPCGRLNTRENIYLYIYNLTLLICSIVLE